MFDIDDKVTFFLPDGSSIEGIVKKIWIKEDTVRYAVKCISNSLIYLVEEIKDTFH